MIEKKHLLSVIIPMYNCAPVIERCLRSIDYTDCEILVVNDGSTDDSEEVVKNYTLSHPNVRLINKLNEGVSSARNMGIEEAKGKYIAFVDADDYVLRGGFQYVVELAEKNDADVLKFDVMSTKKDIVNYNFLSVDTSHINTIKTTGKDVLMRYDIADTVVWDGIYRRDLIVNNNIRFHTDLKLHEDDVFNGMVYCHARTVIAANVVLYCYVIASSCSWTHRQDAERIRVLIKSGYLAAKYRGDYVRAIYPEIMGMERLKYMRYVCQTPRALDAKLSLTEYKNVLNEFRTIGLYPLDYKWISVAFWYLPKRKRIKYAVKTFLTNHPLLGYMLMKFKKMIIRNLR